MVDYTYRHLLDQVEQLTPEKQLQFAQDVLAIYSSHVAPQAVHSILELEGLGKEIWEGVDVDAYINQERDSWGG
jgi:hypothetical protein